MNCQTSIVPRWIRLAAPGAAALVLAAAASSAAAAPPEVVTVPWRGGLDLPHETYNGKQIHLKGIARALAAGATASWDPGDGSAAKVVTVNPAASEPTVDYDLGVTHTYPPSAPGTPYTATLTVCNPGNECASDTYRVVVRARAIDVEINVAIDQGLWYLHRQQIRNPASSDDGRFPYTTSYSRDGMVTASAVQAFQINNHFKGGPDAQDPYADTVRRGLRYMFSRLVSTPITPQAAGNPDTNGNGLGVSPGNTATPLPTGVGNDGPYQGGQFMDAIVTSKTPNEPVPAGTPLAALTSPSTGGAYNYFDAVQDMVDMYAFGQNDPATGAQRGGWRYGWNYGSSDNSANQWAAIGIIPARDDWGATVPQFLIDENLIWLSASQTPAPPSPAIGYGYTGRGEGSALSPSGLVQAVMDGVLKTDASRWVGVEQRMADLWSSWYRDTVDEYSLYALTKAMRLALPSPIIIMGTGANAIDWFKADCANPDACTSSDRFGVARTLIRDQNADGLFNGSYRVSGNYRSAWSVIMLTGTLKLEPVAIADATPNPGASGVPVELDGTASFHQDPQRSIVKYEWDVDNDNVTDYVGATVSHAFTCTTLPCSFPVRLTVTDDGTPTPLVATTTVTVQITNPPHPPTAHAGGPYWACVGESIALDGSDSFDIDEGTGLPGNDTDRITAWDWELNPPPFAYDDASGEMATTAYATPGQKNIGLRVTDNSAAAFGGPNLTDEAFTEAKVVDCGCVSNFTARAKLNKIQLTWAAVAGAANYDIYRSTAGASVGYSRIAADHVTSYATYLDSGLIKGKSYWYRVVPKSATGAELCGSAAASVVPTERTRR